jgi:hypothetical protein
MGSIDTYIFRAALASVRCDRMKAITWVPTGFGIDSAIAPTGGLMTFVAHPTARVMRRSYAAR